MKWLMTTLIYLAVAGLIFWATFPYLLGIEIVYGKAVLLAAVLKFTVSEFKVTYELD